LQELRHGEKGVEGSRKRAQIVEMVATMVAPLLLPKNPLIAQETKVGKAVYATAFLPATVIYLLPIVLIARLATLVLVIFFLSWGSSTCLVPSRV
jgi:hypothetical protein